ncbi:hypothetical protein AB1N83_003556 [Pleurotus pulmonarius]
MYSSTFIFINLDKHQSHKIQWPPSDSLELGRSLAIIGSFDPEVPFYDLGTVFKRVFGYDLSCMALERTALGTFSKLPDELICHVAQIGDLRDALILSATNGYLFTILYAIIVENIRRIDAAKRWNGDRLICIGHGERTLPDNYLTEDERNEVVAWWYNYEWEDNPEIPPSKSTIEATLTEIGPDDYSALCEELGVALYEYGSAMPSLEEVKDQQSRACALPEGILEHPQISKTDIHRLIALELSVLSRGRLVPHAPESERVLVNLTKREYIKAIDGGGHFILWKAIPHLTRWGWGWGWGEALGTDERGDWAGDRVSLILCSELEEKIKCEEGWKEKVVQWSSDE